MSDEARDALDQRLADLGEGDELPGEKGDRKFTVDGQAYRVRVRINEEIPPDAPVNGTPDLAPNTVSLTVSVVGLDAKGKPMTDGAGRLMILAVGGLTIQADEIVLDDFDPQRSVMQAVAAAVDEAGKSLIGRAKIPGVLDGWGATEAHAVAKAEAAEAGRLAADEKAPVEPEPPTLLPPLGFPLPPE